jgi:RNA polymerase sigma-70 factor (ECF subfamily)
MNTSNSFADDPSLISSFTDTMRRLREHDEEASRAVFQRYVKRLLALAQSKLSRQIRQKEDPEDVVQSAFNSFFQRCGDGSLDFQDWESIWSMLALITVRKCVKRARHYKARRRAIAREAPAAAGDSEDDLVRDLIADAPSPEEEAILHDTVTELLAGLEIPRHRDIVLLTLQGYSVEEVAAQLDCADRTVTRVLDKVRLWLENHGKQIDV